MSDEHGTKTVLVQALAITLALIVLPTEIVIKAVVFIMTFFLVAVVLLVVRYIYRESFNDNKDE